MIWRRRRGKVGGVLFPLNGIITEDGLYYLITEDGLYYIVQE